MEDLVPHVQIHCKFLPRAGASIEVLDQEVMKLYELQQGTYPEDHCTYKQDPPNCLVALLQWWIIGGLMTLMSDPIRVKLMDAAASAPVTRWVAPQEDPPPPPPPSHPPPLPPTRPPPSAAATPLTEVQQIFRAVTKAPREQAPPSSAPPLMSLKVPTPSHLVSSSAGASTQLSTAAPSTTTHLVVSTSGSTRQVANPQEDIPPLDTIPVPDIPPLNTIPMQDLPHRYLAVDMHFYLQQLVPGHFPSLTAACTDTSLPNPLEIDVLFPSYCWPNTWGDIRYPCDPWVQSIAVGWHPTLAANLSIHKFEEFQGWLRWPNVKAIGEVGLDYFRIDHRLSQWQWARVIHTQQKLLQSVCDEAALLKKPIVIHCRDAVGSEDASHDCIQIMSSTLPLSKPIYLHCFSQFLGVAYEWTQHFQEVYLGISPIILHSPPAGMEEVVCHTPYDCLLLETDSPCLGTSPAQLYHITEKVQDWKKDDTSLDNILLKAWQATLAFYHL